MTGEDAHESAIRAVCDLGDRLRFGELQDLSPAQREALRGQSEHKPFDDLAYEAAITLCEARDEAGSALLQLLNDPRRRFDATKALSRLRTEAVRDCMRRQARRLFLPWPDRLVASAVCVLFDAPEKAFFERTLASRWFTVRRAMAIHLIGELRLPHAYETLTQMAERRDEPLRGTAIRALAHLADRRAVSKLSAYREPEVQEDVAYALDLLRPQA